MALSKYQAQETDCVRWEAVKSRMISVAQEDKDQQAGKPYQCKVKFSHPSCWQSGTSHQKGKSQILHFPHQPALTGFRGKAGLTWKPWNPHLGPRHLAIRTCPRHHHRSPAQGQPGEQGWPQKELEWQRWSSMIPRRLQVKQLAMRRPVAKCLDQELNGAMALTMYRKVSLKKRKPPLIVRWSIRHEKWWRAFLCWALHMHYPKWMFINFLVWQNRPLFTDGGISLEGVGMGLETGVWLWKQFCFAVTALVTHISQSFCCSTSSAAQGTVTGQRLVRRLPSLVPSHGHMGTGGERQAAQAGGGGGGS